MNISVIICTYNGSNTIVRCLDAILAQETYLKYEIIVVDNNSDDATFALVDNYAKNNKNINIILLNEKKAGKVNALQKGVLMSSGDLVIICDDDNYLGKRYFNVAYNFFKNNPQCGAACGQNFPISDSVFPSWFKDFEVLYGCGSLLNETGTVNNLWGAGMVINGTIVRQLYSSGLIHFLGTTYNNGNRYNSIRLSGEDNELCLWIKLLGYQLYYIKDLILEHDIPMQRLTQNYRDNLLYGIEISNLIFKNKYEVIKSALKSIRKKDFINIFLPTNAGKVSRLKLGITRRGKLYRNYSILKGIIK